MIYLLDTNVCIALLRGKPVSVRIRFQKAIGAGVQVYVSSIVAVELWYGVAKSSQGEANRLRLEAFFAGPMTPLAFEDEDAEVAGKVRAALEKQGNPIGAYDLLIGSQALRHKFTLVTANSSEFARIQGLAWEDWSKP